MLAANNRRGAVQQTFDTVIGATYTFNWHEGYLSGGLTTPLEYTAEIVGVTSAVSHFVSPGAFNTINWSAANPLSFVATSTSATLLFNALGAHGNGFYGVAVDNVSLFMVPPPPPAPEPSSLAMLALGAVLCGVRKRARLAARNT